jgi:hypothetical protein
MDAQRAQQEQQAAGSASSDAFPWAMTLHSLPQSPGAFLPWVHIRACVPPAAGSLATGC